MVCLSKEGDLFQYVLTPSGLTESAFLEAKQANSSPQNIKHWAERNHHLSEMTGADVELTDTYSPLDQSELSSDEMYMNCQNRAVLLPKFLPLLPPLFIPPGVIGSAELGWFGVRDELDRHFRSGEHQQWLNHPLVIEWLQAVGQSPLTFATTWHPYEQLSNYINPGPMNCLPTMKDWRVNKFVVGAVYGLVYRLHLDYIRHALAVKQPDELINFESYMKKAYDSLFEIAEPGSWRELYSVTCYGNLFGYSKKELLEGKIKKIHMELVWELWGVQPPFPADQWCAQFNFHEFVVPAQNMAGTLDVTLVPYLPKEKVRHHLYRLYRTEVDQQDPPYIPDYMRRFMRDDYFEEDFDEFYGDRLYFGEEYYKRAIKRPYQVAFTEREGLCGYESEEGRRLMEGRYGRLWKQVVTEGGMVEYQVDCSERRDYASDSDSQCYSIRGRVECEIDTSELHDIASDSDSE